MLKNRNNSPVISNLDEQSEQPIFFKLSVIFSRGLKPPRETELSQIERADLNFKWNFKYFVAIRVYCILSRAFKNILILNASRPVSNCRFKFRVLCRFFQLHVDSYILGLISSFSFVLLIPPAKHYHLTCWFSFHNQLFNCINRCTRYAQCQIYRNT